MRIPQFLLGHLSPFFPLHRGLAGTLPNNLLRPRNRRDRRTADGRKLQPLPQQAGVLVAVRPGVQPMETTVRLALREDFCVIGSDGGIEKERCANNHPRGANCFASAIRYALDERIPLEKILDKMTTRSARIIGFPMRGRGELRNGYIADLTVFNPETIRGRQRMPTPANSPKE